MPRTVMDIAGDIADASERIKILNQKLGDALYSQVKRMKPDQDDPKALTVIIASYRKMLKAEEQKRDRLIIELEHA